MSPPPRSPRSAPRAPRPGTASSGLVCAPTISRSRTARPQPPRSDRPPRVQKGRTFGHWRRFLARTDFSCCGAAPVVDLPSSGPRRRSPPRPRLRPRPSSRRSRSTSATTAPTQTGRGKHRLVALAVQQAQKTNDLNALADAAQRAPARQNRTPRPEEATPHPAIGTLEADAARNTAQSVPQRRGVSSASCRAQLTTTRSSRISFG